jgi:hypothetical protein
MAKITRTTGQTMIYRTLHRKLKTEQHETHKHRSEIGYSGRVSSSCFNSGTRRVTLVTKLEINHE